MLSPLSVALTTWLLFVVQNWVALHEGGGQVRPFGIGFVIPIVLLTALGGRPVGLLTLLFSLIASIYCLTPPYFSWHALNVRDWIETGMVVLVGGIVIFAVEALRHNTVLLDQVKQSAQQRQDFMRDVLVSVTDGKLNLCDTSALLPVPLMPLGQPIPLRKETLALLRRKTDEAAAACRMPDERRADLMTAVSECAMNAVVHAGGGVGQVCADKDGTVQVWVEDKGTGIAMEHLPQATFQKGFTTAGTLGFGFKMMLQAADRLWLLTGPAGTTIVMEQDREPPMPRWL